MTVAETIEQGLVVEDTGDCVVLRLDRPHSQNALTPSVLHAVRAALDEAPHRPVVVSSTGAHFSSGYDIGELGGDARRAEAEYERTLVAIEQHPYPVLAALRGNCIGAGLGLAAACDVRVAGEGASFLMPPARLGVVYPLAGVRRLVDLIGPAWATLALCAAERLDAPTALSAGLVQGLHPDHEVEGAALRLARLISRRAPLSVRGAKRMVRALRSGPVGAEEVGDLEALVAEAQASEDLKEALRARAEGRDPVFRGA